MKKCVVGIYLAAGKSRRMQRPKLSIELSNGKRIGGLALEAALQSNLEYIVIVTRKDDALDWLPADTYITSKKNSTSLVVCEEADLGMSYSIRSGLEAAKELGADAVVVLLADQPFVSTMMIDRLIHTYLVDDKLDYVASGAARSINKEPPVLLAKSLFAVMGRLEGDVGARMIMTSSPYNGAVVREDEGFRFCDADTLEDVKVLTRIARELSL